MYSEKFIPNDLCFNVTKKLTGRKKIVTDLFSVYNSDLGCISYGNYSYLALDNILHSVLWESFPQ